jgi:hypothetical protein
MGRSLQRMSSGGLSPEMREAVESARVVITAMAEGMATGDYAFVDGLVSDIERDLARMEDRAAAADRAGNLIQASARLAVFVAELPRLIFQELERDGVTVPAEAFDLFGDAQSALRSAFILVAGLEGEQ